MKRTTRLTESELHGLIRECIEEIIYENRQPLTEAFQSQKLAKLVQQHDGIDKDSRLGKKLQPVIMFVFSAKGEISFQNPSVLLSTCNPRF